MKTAREHRVPLCGRALEILDAARKLGNGVSPNRVRYGAWESAKRRADAPATRKIHDRGRAAWVPVIVPGLGRRRDGPSREVVEAALAHEVRNKVEAAYRRTDCSSGGVG